MFLKQEKYSAGMTVVLVLWRKPFEAAENAFVLRTMTGLFL